MGSIAATFASMHVLDIKPDVMVIRPLQGCASAFWVELIVTFIVMFLVASLTHQAQSVSTQLFVIFKPKDLINYPLI